MASSRLRLFAVRRAGVAGCVTEKRARSLRSSVVGACDLMGCYRRNKWCATEVQEEMKFNSRKIARQTLRCVLLCLALILMPALSAAQELSKVEKIELQPLAAQAKRIIEAMDYLGSPISQTDKQALDNALAETDEKKAVEGIQSVLDRYCLFDVSINPESRVRVSKGLARSELFEQGWQSFLVKVRNEAG